MIFKNLLRSLTGGNKYLTLSNKLDIISFELLFTKHRDNIQAIYDELMESGIDRVSLGFWIWDIPNNREIYSPKFRHALGFKDETDFPNVPDSWRNQIEEDDLNVALANFVRHVESKSRHQYEQTVTYRKKHGGKVSLVCIGKVVSWEEDKPKLMIGVHKHI